MKSLEDTQKLVKQLEIKPRSEMRSKVLDDALKLQQSRCGQHSPDTTIWSNIMHTKRIKFIAAAVILIVTGISLVYWQSHKEIQIPPELAAMSVDELIKLHYEQNNTTFSPDIIKTALQRALQKTDPEQVIQIAKAVLSESEEFSAELAAPPVHPVEPLSYITVTFPDVLEKSEIFVHADLLNIEINVDDIINALTEKEHLIEDFYSRYRVTLTWEIADTLPEGVLLSGEIIDIPTVINERELRELKKHTTYDFGMTLDSNNEPHFLDYFAGVYPVDLNNQANLEFWQFLTDARDILTYGNPPEQIAIDYWTSKLQGDTFLLALEYMNLLPDDLIPANAIMDAVETRYWDLVAQVEQNYNDAVERGEQNIPIYADGEVGTVCRSSMPVFHKVIPMLPRTGNQDCINRMLTLFDNDIDYGRKSILWRGFLFNDRAFITLIVHLMEAAQGDVLSERLMDIYTDYQGINWTEPYASWVPPYGNLSHSDEYKELEALYQSGAQEEAAAKAFEMLAVPPRQERASDLRGDMFRNGDLLLILGKSGRDDLIDYVEGFTQQEYIDHCQQIFEELEGHGTHNMDRLQQYAVMALARLGGQSAIPRLRQLYNSSNWRIKFTAAVALYYNGDMTGEKLVRKLVEGTHRQDPEIEIQWGDISDGTVFQEVINSYLRNDLTDALYLEKLTHYLDRADRNINSDFFDDYKSEILHIVVEHLNNRDRWIRGYATIILQNATGQNFGFDPNKYHGRQDDIIQQWRDYLDQEYPASQISF